ncbi:MAG: hypothetical protein ACLRUZ_00955 [Faecalimonas sp.]
MRQRALSQPLCLESLPHIGGEKQLAAGADKLTALKNGLTQTKDAVGQLYAAIDGTGDNDIQVASQKLAEGTKKLNDAVSGMNNLLSNVDTMTSTGKEQPHRQKDSSEVVMQKQIVPLQCSGNDEKRPGIDEDFKCCYHSIGDDQRR